MKLKINEEYRNLIPPLSTEEYRQLELNIMADGCRDPLVVWDGTIIDGHNRHAICTEHGIDFNVEQIEFETSEDAKDWIDANQLGRRNLTQDQRRIAIGRRYNREKKNKEDNLKQNAPKGKTCTSATADKLAEVHKTSPRSVKNYAKDAELYERLQEEEPQAAKDVWSGKKTLKAIRREQKYKERVEAGESAEAKVEEAAQVIPEDLEHGWHRLGKHYLYFGSNLDDRFLEGLPNCQLAFADPPYNAGVDRWDNGFRWEQDYLQDIADIVAVTPGGWNAADFYKQTDMNYIWELACWIKNGMTHGRCGYANWIKTSLFSKYKVRIPQDHYHITIKTSETVHTKHKGRKPYDYMFWIIDSFTEAGDSIVDPFAGSGTTLVMSEAMDRKCYTAEIDKDYCLDIIDRVINKGVEYEQC